MSNTKPFIRWAGGKSWLIPHVKSIILNLEYRNYYEPFIGGGAIFFSLQQKKNVYLSDINPELIDSYISIRDHPNLIIKELKHYTNTESEYYRIRALEPDNMIERAARFIYLNQTSYNGLYRVNKKGKYNVPYGHRQNLNYNYDRLRIASQKLQKVRIHCEDFSKKKYRIREGDLIFLDPPYTVSHNNNGFIEYNQNLFSLDDQKRLSKYIDYIKSKGAYYILTNAAHNAIKEIFTKEGDSLTPLDRHSLIGGKKAKRSLISEYIFTNIPKGV
ncbi:DNA adenine methylase [Abyssisolibacter fermentans]|uniref:DNA adenine methylase n=1 Tax=Abyssisolibacter fermentans TaxID=1766203 RepID=UPI0008378A2E|nr:Dam family site-specific DNA-(adenine-N6)-methyltransferase [Abyssisolibacter fermentans]